jgi:multidrug efflux system membrane fusion protein
VARLSENIVGIMWQKKKRLNKTNMIWGGLALLSLWMASGLMVERDFEAEEVGNVAKSKLSEQLKIEVQAVSAQNKRRFSVVQGETKPKRHVKIMAETTARVSKIVASEGAAIKAGAVIVQLDMEDRAERIAALQASVAQRITEYEAARRLSQRGFESKVRLLRNKADLEKARAELKQAQIDAENTQIKAAFDGFIEKIHVREGDLVGVAGGSAVADLIDINPILAVGNIAQNDRIFVDEKADIPIIMPNGDEYSGKINYIARSADSASRAFLLEVKIDNPNGAILSGLSTTIKMPLNEVKAHFIPSSSLSLRDDGSVQVKSLSAENKVESHLVKIIDEESGGVWVEGLPNEVRLITKGAAYLSIGEIVGEDNITFKDSFYLIKYPILS